MDDLRHTNIAIVVAAVIAAVGAFAFRRSGEAALQLVGLVAFLGGFAAYCLLDELAQRRKGKSRQ